MTSINKIADIRHAGFISCLMFEIKLNIVMYKMIILTVLIRLFPVVVYSQTNHGFLFKTLTFRDGLSNTQVTDMAQDSLGYLWFGTENGLNRFDGSEIVVYKHVLNDSTSLTNNRILKIFIDSRQRMWLITASGVCRYQPATNDFKTYALEASADQESNLPLDMVERPDGSLMVLSCCNMVSVFSEERERFEQYMTIAFDGIVGSLCMYRGRIFAGAQQFLLEIHPTNGQVIDTHKLYDDSQPLSSGIFQLLVANDQLWITGSMMHLQCFDPTTRTLKKLYTLPYTTAIASLNEETLLAGSYEGEYLYHIPTGKVTPLHAVEDEGFLKNIVHVFVDKDHNLWAANPQQGVIYTAGQRIFKDIRHFSPDLVPYTNEISSLSVIGNRQLWLGLNTGQVFAIDLKTFQYQIFYDTSETERFPGVGTVFNIFQDHKKRIWIGSYEGGLRWYDPATGSFRQSDANTDSLRIRSRDIRSIVEDAQRHLWLAVHGRGIDVYDPARQAVVATHGYSAGDTEPYIGDWIFQLVIAPDSAVWIASSSGLQYIKGRTKKYFQHHQQVLGSLSNDQVNCLLLDRRGYLWIGTAEGLNVYNAEDASFTKFTTRQGLSDNYISSMIEDTAGNLWTGTYDGLSRLSYADVPQNAVVQDIELPRGLYSNQFIERASTVDSTGNLYFATTHGLLSFNPKDLSFEEQDLEVLLTGLQVIEQSPKEDKEARQPAISLKDTTLSDLGHIRLKPKENNLLLSFSAIDFVHSGQIRYHYRLKGYHNQWLVSTERSVEYHDLPAGEYEFQVKAALANATRTSHPKSLFISIRSPWYYTAGGKIAILGVLIGLLLLGVWIWMERIRMKSQAAFDKKEREIDQLKIEFFMNVSHEFRTPLTLILGPLEKLVQSARDSQEQQYLHMIERNTHRLSRLVGQLLDLRRLELDHYQLRVAEGNLVAFVRDIYYSFYYLAEQQSITFLFSDHTQGLTTSWFDADALDKILCNLLSNAFKYTPDRGSIEVTISMHPTLPGWAVVSISDTGVGIGEDQLHRIFDRFYRVETTAHQGGNGIGLSLCQELVHLHQGEITVDSEPGKGSTFELAVPIQADAYHSNLVDSPSTKAIAKSTNIPHVRPLTETKVPGEANIPALQDDSEEPKPLVLVIDDQADLLLFVRESIGQQFTVITAQNGQEGFQKAITSVPDAIVSDVAMPLMNGFQLVEKLKEDMRTSHIPIILLTARATEQLQVEGLHMGADDYMTKPFQVNVLVAKLHNLIANREKLRKLFSGTDWSGLQRQVRESTENTFLLKLTTFIDKNIEDASFGTDDICRALGMSRSQLYRKVTAITGKSVHEFVKLYRLSKATELLYIGHHTITEVATLTGFKYVQSFTRSFKEHYGCTPTQYANRHIQKI